MTICVLFKGTSIYRNNIYRRFFLKIAFRGKKGQREVSQSCTRNLLGVMDMFTFFTVVKVHKSINMSKLTKMYTLTWAVYNLPIVLQYNNF